MQYDVDAGILMTDAGHGGRRAVRSRSERSGDSIAMVIPLDRSAYEARYREQVDPPMRGLLVGVLAGAYIWMVVAGIVVLIAT